jgi:predicted MFS family arabinose efflux permease
MMTRSAKAEFAAAYTGIMSVAVLNVLPALAGVLTLDLGWNEEKIGRFASADSIGALGGTLLAAALLRWRSFRVLTVAGMAVLAIADIASGLSHSVAVITVTRLLGGLGGGLAMGISFAVFAATRPERGMALWSVGQLVFGFIAITALPQLTAAFGWEAAFFCLAALALAGLGLAQYLPAERLTSVTEGPAQALPVTMGFYAWLGVIGVGIFYFGQGAVWPYLEIIGLTSGIDHKSVETSLSVSAASAIAGSILVVLVGRRLGRTLPLFLSFAVTIAAILTIRSPDPTAFRGALAAFTFAWPVFACYQFALVVADNRSGRSAAFVTSANFAGLVAGPLVAGEVIPTGGFGSMQWLAITMNAAALLSLIPLMRCARSR